MPSPWDYWQQERAFRVDAGEYDFPIYAQPKQRHGPSGSKAATRNWEQCVFQASEDQAPRIIPAGRLGIHALFLAQKKSGDLSNMLKSLEDALNHRAWNDDEQIDYVKMMRVYGPDVPERILLRVLERTDD